MLFAQGVQIKTLYDSAHWVNKIFHNKSFYKFNIYLRKSDLDQVFARESANIPARTAVFQ
jgi:hypothetical protein